MNRKTFFNILKVVVSLSLLTFIFLNLDLPAFLQSIRGADPWWMTAALTMMMLGVVIRALRWQILLTAIGVPVPLINLTAIYFIGFLFNNLLPSGLGGDAIRMLELKPYAEHGSDTVTSVIVDRFLGLSALQAIALIALLFDWRAVPSAFAYFTVAIFVGGLIIGALLINRRLYMWLQEHVKPFRLLTNIKMIGRLFESFQRYPLSALGKSYLVAFLFNLVHITMHTFIGWGLGMTATLVQYAVFVPITSLALLVPISFAGLGVREETYRQLFGQVGVPSETAVAMSLLVYFFGNICTGLIGGVIYLLRSARDVVSEKG